MKAILSYEQECDFIAIKVFLMEVFRLINYSEPLMVGGRIDKKLLDI